MKHTVILSRLHFKTTAFILAVLCLVMTFSSCSEDDGSGYIFKTNISGNPQNLDPQMARDNSSKMVIMNTFDGLVRMSSDGTIEKSAAESYSLSEDGLIYTFILKDNIYWYGLEEFSSQLTADDFVFAFRRILGEKSDSPYAKEYSCIKNANAIMSGMLDESKLGIRAVDSLTVEIELEYPYYNFLEMLTHTAAMPCNEEFFISTKGRYGLSAETTLSNSAFYLKEWNYDPYWDNNYIILRRNILNNEQNKVYPYSVNLFITKDSSGDVNAFNNEKIDCAVTDVYSDKLLSNNQFSQCQSIAYGLVFNSSSQSLNSSLKYALAASVNHEEYKDAVPQNLTMAYGIIPEAVSVVGKKYREMAADNSFSTYNPTKAAKVWQDELEKKNLVSVDGIKITVPESFSGIAALSNITEQWQKELGFFCGIEVVSEKEYKSKLSDGSYDIILSKLTASYNDAQEFLNYFKSGSNTNFSGYYSPSVEGLLGKVKTAGKLSDAVELFKEAESSIINDCGYIPLFYGNEYFVYINDAKDLECHPFTGLIIFKDGKKF